MGGPESTAEALEPTVWVHDGGDADAQKEDDEPMKGGPHAAPKAEPQESTWDDRLNMLVRIYRT